MNSYVEQIQRIYFGSVTTVISHADCPDGILSANIMRYALGDDTHVCMVKHTDSIMREPREGCLFVDIAPPPSHADAWRDKGAIVLDHHKSARSVVSKFIAVQLGAYADETEHPGVSGALLAYYAAEEILGQALPNIRKSASLAGIRDTWQKSHPLWEAACNQAAFLMLSRSTKAHLTHNEIAMGERIRQRDRRVAAERAFTIYTEQRAQRYYPFYYMNGGEGNISDVADAMRIYYEVDNKPFITVFQLLDQGGVYFSMRSLHEHYDVSAIAKEFGGGGHTKAAGFTIEHSTDVTAALGALRSSVSGFGWSP